MKRFLLLGSASALVLVAVACGGSAASVPSQTESPTSPGDDNAESGNTTPTTPAEAGTDTAPPPPTPPPPKCTEITNGGADVTAHTVGSAAPTATGGAFADGTYHLTDLSVYTGSGESTPLALTIRGTIAIHGSAIDFVQDANGKHVWGTQSFTVTGTTVAFTTVCGTAPPTAMTYSAGEKVQMFLPNDVGQVVGYTYEK